MSKLKAFGLFWWDFIVGDDWRIALAVVLSLAGTAGLVLLNIAAWWLIPAVAMIMLTVSVVRAARDV